MVDTLTSEQRSQLMSRIRGKDTKPEMLLRRALHRMGYRYRIHAKHLPGNPDLVFASRRKAVWVHGCFWHWHRTADCPIGKIPKSRSEYWLAKLKRNSTRDVEKQAELQALGWETMVVWECSLRPKCRERTLREVVNFLESLS